MARYGRHGRSTTTMSSKRATTSPSCESTAQPRSSSRPFEIGEDSVMEGAVAVLVLFAIVVVAKSVKVIPQAEAAVIERLGRYSKTVSGQLTLLLPFIDKIRARVDLRERVVSFPPQPVITEDNLTVNIDTVVYFQVTNP